MNKTSYAQAFQEATGVARRSAERALGRELSHDVIVRMYGAGANGLDVSAEEFVKRSYINDDVFYRLIDLMVIKVIGSRPVLFARISDHPPGPLSGRWNGDKGPFKQLAANAIMQR